MEVDIFPLLTFSWDCHPPSWVLAILLGTLGSVVTSCRAPLHLCAHDATDALPAVHTHAATGSCEDKACPSAEVAREKNEGFPENDQWSSGCSVGFQKDGSLLLSILKRVPRVEAKTSRFFRLGHVDSRGSNRVTNRESGKVLTFALSSRPPPCSYPWLPWFSPDFLLFSIHENFGLLWQPSFV